MDKNCSSGKRNKEVADSQALKLNISSDLTNRDGTIETTLVNHEIIITNHENIQSDLGVAINK